MDIGTLRIADIMEFNLEIREADEVQVESLRGLDVTIKTVLLKVALATKGVDGGRGEYIIISLFFSIITMLVSHLLIA